jgi:hypothetical protein
LKVKKTIRAKVMYLTKVKQRLLTRNMRTFNVFFMVKMPNFTQLTNNKRSGSTR